MSLRKLTLILGFISVAATPYALGNTLGPLENLLVQGESDGWRGATDRGAYWLENPAQEGAIRYFYAPYTEGSGGKRHFSIDVNVANTRAEARAGMLYGLQGDPLRYFMIIIGRGGQVEVYRRDPNGVQQMMASTAEVQNGFNRVEIRESGKSVEFFVNEKSMGSFETNHTGQGALGIAAMGVGRFGFANYNEREGGGWFN